MTMSSTIQEVVLEFYQTNKNIVCRTLSIIFENKMFVIIQRGNLQAL